MPISGKSLARDAAGKAHQAAPTKPIESTPSAYSYPLLIKHLLHTPLRHAPDQEIVYRDLVRYDYRTLAQRIGRLANGLASLGVGPGDTVGVLDWDSHRYLEGYFAVPGMGAVLHMVNIRLSPEQILYTINHAEDDVLLVHADFLPLIEGLRDRIERVRTIIVMVDEGDVPATPLEIAAEYEALLASSSAEYDFPDFDENTRATTFYTTGTTGLPKGVYFSHRQLVLHTLATATALGTAAEQGRLHRGDVYMPITPMFHVHAWGLPFIATMLGIKQVYPGRYAPGNAAQADRNREGDVLPLRPDPAPHAFRLSGQRECRLPGADDDHRRLGPAQGSCPGRA